MKFRGKCTDISCIKQLTKLIILVSRLSKHCVIRITPRKLYFIINDIGANHPGLWADLEQGHFFNEYDMEGVTADDNEIYIEVIPDQVAKSLMGLKNSQSTRSLKLKLTKKHSPCLTLEVEMPSLSARCRLVVHDIPVTLIPRRLWHLYQEPHMPQFQASVYLPPLKQLQSIVGRMKNLSFHAAISASRKGAFAISLATDTVDVRTYFKQLSMPPWDGGEEGEPQDLTEMHSATVDLKKLHLFLSGEQVNPCGVICNISAGKMIHLFLLHDDFTLQYFLPAFSPE